MTLPSFRGDLRTGSIPWPSLVVKSIQFFFLDAQQSVPPKENFNVAGAVAIVGQADGFHHSR